MQQEIIQKAIELLEKSEHLTVFIPTDADLDCLAAAETLTAVLCEQNKQINFLSRPRTENMPHPSFFKKIAASAVPPREFIVSLDTTFSPVSQLKYERLENKIEVVFSPKTTPLKKEFVSFKEGRMMSDCILALGIGDLESLQDAERVNPEFFTENPIINFDFSEKNKNYGEANLIDVERCSLAEVLYDFLSIYYERPLPKELATLLLAGLAFKSGGFKESSAGPDAFVVASELLRLGADKDLAFFLAQRPLPLNLAQLLGRASIRTRAQESGNLIWSYLTHEDFEKTGRDSQDVSTTLEHLSQTLAPHQNLALLWQDPLEKTIQTFLTGNPKLMIAIEQKGLGDYQSRHLRLSTKFKSFKEAEEYLISLL